MRLSVPDGRTRRCSRDVSVLRTSHSGTVIHKTVIINRQSLEKRFIRHLFLISSIFGFPIHWSSAFCDTKHDYWIGIANLIDSRSLCTAIIASFASFTEDKYVTIDRPFYFAIQSETSTVFAGRLIEPEHWTDLHKKYNSTMPPHSLGWSIIIFYYYLVDTHVIIK